MRDTEATSDVHEYATTTGPRPEADVTIGERMTTTRRGWRYSVEPVPGIVQRSHVQWGGVFAGMLSALTFFIFASLCGMAIDVLNVFSGSAATNQFGWGAGLWTLGSILVAFLIGGYVAERVAYVRGEGNGWINGAMTFVLGLGFIVLASGMGGASSLFGAFGTIMSDVHNVAMTATGQANAITNVHQGLWWAFVAIAVGVIFGAIGGMLGDIGTPTVTEPETRP